MHHPALNERCAPAPAPPSPPGHTHTYHTHTHAYTHTQYIHTYTIQSIHIHNTYTHIQRPPSSIVSLPIHTKYLLYTHTSLASSFPCTYPSHPPRSIKVLPFAFALHLPGSHPSNSHPHILTSHLQHSWSQPPCKWSRHVPGPPPFPNTRNRHLTSGSLQFACAHSKNIVLESFRSGSGLRPRLYIPSVARHLSLCGGSESKKVRNISYSFVNSSDAYFDLSTWPVYASTSHSRKIYFDF
ncbi:hypothetical protein EV426DRAFT_172810 [Tirmania nivea]|nr:hypothetical protein EV426DRAFT_172810 [Tirmania nivea]